MDVDAYFSMSRNPREAALQREKEMPSQHFVFFARSVYHGMHVFYSARKCSCFMIIAQHLHGVYSITIFSVCVCMHA
jgi:hypothetical protein